VSIHYFWQMPFCYPLHIRIEYSASQTSVVYPLMGYGLHSSWYGTCDMCKTFGGRRLGGGRLPRCGWMPRVVFAAGCPQQQGAVPLR